LVCFRLCAPGLKARGARYAAGADRMTNAAALALAHDIFSRLPVVARFYG
jgi:hypothetical protein